ncbi:hypothetical protein C8J57DRAFT_1541346 [Mycena rebaudengoi]|nr:hypothetical protein C8J57DRAFT_1541346 [Mycena rebaudengoi]
MPLPLESLPSTLGLLPSVLWMEHPTNPTPGKPLTKSTRQMLSCNSMALQIIQDAAKELEAAQAIHTITDSITDPRQYSTAEMDMAISTASTTAPADNTASKDKQEYMVFTKRTLTVLRRRTTASSKAGVSAHWVKAIGCPKSDPSPPPSPFLGGLNNKDIVSTKPQYTATHKPAAGLLLLTRKNELVEVPFIVKQEPKIAALPISQPRKKVKLEHTSSLSGLANSSASNFTPPSSDNVKGMPAFLAHKWQQQIILALYQALNTSLTPLDMGFPGPVMVKLLQSIIDDVCPGNTYKVQWNDPVCTKV